MKKSDSYDGNCIFGVVICWMREKESPCDVCNGAGCVSVIIDPATCTQCNETGEDAFGGTCGTCYGTGQTHHYDTKKCEKCGRDGVIIE